MPLDTKEIKALERVAKGLTNRVINAFDREDLEELVELEEGQDLWDALVSWFFTTAAANFCNDVPFLQDRRHPQGRPTSRT